MRLREINSPGELTVDPDLIDRFTQAGWQIDGEGQDQLVMSKPGSNTVLKVVGTGSQPRQAQIRRYVEFFRANQRDPHFPRVGADRELAWKGRKYYAYTQERLRPLSGDEAVMDYLEYAMGELGHDQEPDFERIPPGLSVEQIEGLIGSVDHMFQAGLGGQYGFDLANMANIMQRAEGQLVIVDPFSGFDDALDEALVHRGQVRSQDPNDVWHVRDDATRKLRHHRGGVVLAQARPQIYQDDAKASYTYTTDARGRRRRSLPSFHWAYIQGRMVNRLPQDISQGRKLWFKRGQGFVYADSQEPFASADYVAFNPDGSVVAYDSGQPAAAAGPVVSVEPAQESIQEVKARYEMTDLDPWTFDQTPAGWRGLPSSARQADAINQYIDRYVKDGQFVGAPEGVKTVRPYILYWHLGQVLTQMGRNAMASRVMRQALDDSDPNWNAYVMATISFLRKDRKDFDHWAPLARGNEETIKRLTAGWGLPYKQAYAGQKAATAGPVVSVEPAQQTVAEGVNDYLWHGSRNQHEILYPQQANDTGGKEESNKNAVYATPSAKVAIAMGLTTPGSDTAMFPNDPQMVLFSGKIRKGQMVYLHKVPKDLFIKHNSREWYSKPGVQAVKPIEVVTVPVDKWLHLIRSATEQDWKLRQHYLDKAKNKEQGVAEGYSNTTFNVDRRKLNVPALIQKGAIFVTYPHGEQGWETDNKEDWAFSLLSLYNVLQGGWPSEAKKYLKPESYKRAEQQINSSAPNLGSDKLVYDGKYNQILWSIKKLGIPDNVAFLDKGQQGVAEVVKMPPTKDSSQGMASWAYQDAQAKKARRLAPLRTPTPTEVYDLGDHLRVFVQDDQGPVLYLALEKFLDGFKSGAVAVEPRGRGQNLAVKIYQAASDTLGRPIYSDTTQTDASRIGIWQRLISALPDRVVGYDQRSGQDLPLTATDQGPAVRGNQPIYTQRTTRDQPKPVTGQTRSRTRLLKLLPSQQVNEVQILAKVKGKGSEPGQIPKYGRPISADQEVRYLGQQVGRMGGYQLWRDWLGGQLSYHVFDPQSRTVVLTTFGSRYHRNPNSYIIHGLYAAPGNPVKAHQFYRHLIQDQGLTLISDRKQSPGGNRVWQRLEAYPDIEVYGFDTKTGEVMNFGAADAEMYAVPPRAAKDRESKYIAKNIRLVATAR